MKKYKYYIIYKTTNLINGKIYIGQHSTNKLDDGYLGSGVRMKSLFRKYKKINFSREILHVFDNYEEMNAKEIELITEEFVKCKDNYNLAIGGRENQGVLSFINYNTNRLNPSKNSIEEVARLTSINKKNGTKCITKFNKTQFCTKTHSVEVVEARKDRLRSTMHLLHAGIDKEAERIRLVNRNKSPEVRRNQQRGRLFKRLVNDGFEFSNGQLELFFNKSKSKIVKSYFSGIEDFTKYMITRNSGNSL